MFNETKINKIIDESVMKVISEVSSNLSMDSAREAARRGDMARASKFGHYAKNAWKREGKPGMLNPGLHGKGKYGFGIMTPNNTENRFNDDDPHGSEFNTEFKTKPDFTKMSPEEKDAYRKSMEDTARGTDELRRYYRGKSNASRRLDNIVKESIQKVLSENDYVSEMKMQEKVKEIAKDALSKIGYGDFSEKGNNPYVLRFSVNGREDEDKIYSVLQRALKTKGYGISVNIDSDMMGVNYYCEVILPAYTHCGINM